MNDHSLEFLKRLVETPSPSGFEQPAQRLFREYVASFADSVTTDVLGNVIALCHPDGSPKVMLTGHSDQIGFIVSYIDDEGFLYFRRIGGIDPSSCVSQRVVIQGKHGAVAGVIGRKAIHLQEPDERTKAPKIDGLWVDIGARNKAEAENQVRIGDSGVFVQTFDVLSNQRAVSMAFDNKMAVWIISEAMRLCAGERDTQSALYAVSTVQEEIGSIGAHTSAFSVQPDVAIVLDVGHATDHPGTDHKKTGKYELDKGPILSRGANINPKVFELLADTAERAQIAYQTEGIGGRSATDADPIQFSRAGIAVGLIHVPLRYMHTPCEMISLVDMENTAKLLKAFVGRLTPGMSFIPE